MIKRIPVRALEVGMYISDMNVDWIPHSNMQKKGRIPNETVIRKIVALGVQDLYIDTFKGKDTQDGLTQAEVDTISEQKLEKAGALPPLIKPRLALNDEMASATQLHSEAITLVNGVMGDVKVGKSLELNAIDQLADGMLDSIFRNHNALACLGCIRDKDSYLMEHSVNLSVLMSIFGKSIQLDRDIMHQIIVGALLHDIGKILVPDEILHKPGKLTDEEFVQMKMHAEHSYTILNATDGVGKLAVLVAAQHHEKMDGSGYPKGLKGEDISPFGRMAAIVDVYDAITSDRCYHKGMPPTMAVKKLLEWSDHHLDRSLVTHFIRCVGIFPVGSLVLLESGRLAVVLEANEQDQRLPVVRVMYHTKFRTYLKTERLDLSLPKVQDRIVKAVEPRDYQIRVGDFLA
jgi:HD-GYP domain-containing protein (c-di-GMP phosphodiesterase class II)